MCTLPSTNHDRSLNTQVTRLADLSVPSQSIRSSRRIVLSIPVSKEQTLRRRPSVSRILSPDMEGHVLRCHGDRIDAWASRFLDHTEIDSLIQREVHAAAIAYYSVVGLGSIKVRHLGSHSAQPCLTNSSASHRPQTRSVLTVFYDPSFWC